VAGTRTTTGSRLRARLARLAVIGVMAALATVVTPGTSSAASVTPSMDCYTVHDDRSRTLVLAYTNSEPVARVIPLSSRNQLSPSRVDGAQPTSFAPGTTHAAFTVRVTETELRTAVWTLDGTRLNLQSAVGYSPRCPAGTQLPADGNGMGTAMAFGGAGVVGACMLHRSRRRLAGPPDHSATVTAA
jgi:hypothetical protein